MRLACNSGGDMLRAVPEDKETRTASRYQTFIALRAVFVADYFQINFSIVIGGSRT
jgi:hypothetical protein